MRTTHKTTPGKRTVLSFKVEIVISRFELDDVRGVYVSYRVSLDATVILILSIEDFPSGLGCRSPPLSMIIYIGSFLHPRLGGCYQKRLGP